MADDFATIRAKGTWTLQKRADFRKQVRNGEISLPETLEEAELPDWLQKAKLLQTIRAQPRVGEATAREIIARFSYPADFTLHLIPHSRRTELAQALREKS